VPPFLFCIIMLYLVATPIGNLADITLRALEALKDSDYILCEDTRHSSVLLNHYEIKKSLKSYHKFNEASMEDRVIEDLRSGKTISLISDAGTPCISDPGFRMVKRCQEEEIAITTLPGPCAAIQALTSSGLDSQRFQFIGFLPRKSGELKSTLIDVFLYEGTTICYESPNRLKATLKMIDELSPNNMVAVCREMTKKFEETKKGTASELIAHWNDRNVKGEIVLVISPKEKHTPWDDITPKEHVAMLQEMFSISEKEAIKLCAELRGTPKRILYNDIHNER